MALLINTYRVLLTRGRDGLVLFVADEPRMNPVALALEEAGVRPLPQI